MARPLAPLIALHPERESTARRSRSTAARCSETIRGVNLDELLREVTSAETAGEIDGAEALLTRALVACKDGLLRAHLHEALANHFGRRCLFRKMNEHEDASAVAFGRLPGGSGIAEAHARYRDAIDAFGSRDDERGLALLRPAVATLRSRLGELHPYARQVTNTLAGRSRDPADRVSLRAAILASSMATTT